MATDALRGFLQLGFFVGGCGFLMAFLQPPQSAEFIVSLCSGAMGLSVVLGVILFRRYLFDALPEIDDPDDSSAHHSNER
jgi:hypothetical protein